MIDYKKLVKDRELRLKLAHLMSFVPSRPYLKFLYRMKTGRKLNLSNPKGFNEKLNWLKVNDIHPEYAKLVDKLAVREHIKETVGEEYLFPLLGAWDSFDQIDFDTLPEQFVLKCNHDSGSVKIIRDKNAIDKVALAKFFDGRLKGKVGFATREYPYKGLQPCIIAEELMDPTNETGLNDYKFFCFNGKPEIMFVATDRATDCRFDFFDMEFNHLPIYNIHPNSDKPIEKPACFEEMKELAARLSQGMKCVRVDLYEINGKIYFGEFTFFHGGGFYLFEPEEWELKLGNLIDIKEVQ